MKTLIAVPCMNTLPFEFVQSILHLVKGDVSVMMKANSLIYDSRNLISLTAIEKGFDRVIWFDSDMVFMPDTLQRLHEDMDKLHCEMVTGLYVSRHEDAVPVIYDELKEPERMPSGFLEKRIHPYMDYPRNSVFTVEGCGFGCVLTSVKLLKAVWDHFGPAFTPYPWAGEDLAFCHRVNTLGYQIYCDSNVSCGHVGQYIYTEDNLKRGDKD